MNNKNAINFAQQLVRHYAKFDKLDNCYNLDVIDIPGFDLHKFSSILLQDRILANEACGSDNASFEKTMLPSLILLMTNSTSRDEGIEFAEEWKEGVTNYFSSTMQSLIDDALQLYNVEHAA